jgi:hypothetical protein
MNLLYISPEFPPNFQTFILRLRDEGVRVWAIGEADFYTMPEPVRAALSWYVRCDLHDRGAVDRALDDLVNCVMVPAGHGSLHLAESHNEFWMRLEAHVNERFNLPGIRPSDMDRLKRKSTMKAQFRDLGLRVAKGALVRTVEEGLSVAARLGWPLIVKPDEGVGASGVRKVHDEAELAAALEAAAEPCVLEEFISAPIVTYDGLTDWDGNVVFANSVVYSCGVLESVQGDDHAMCSRREIPAALDDIGRQLAFAFDIRRKFFHFELFETPEGYVPIEINARPPGGPMVDMMNYAADVDLYAAWAKILVYGQAKLPIDKRWSVGYAGRKERRYALPHDEIVQRCGEALVDHAENPSLYWGGLGRYRYIFRHATEAEVLRTTEEVFRVA